MFEELSLRVYSDMFIDNGLSVKFESCMSCQIYQVHTNGDAEQMLDFDEAENLFKYTSSVQSKQSEWYVDSGEVKYCVFKLKSSFELSFVCFW